MSETVHIHYDDYGGFARGMAPYELEDERLQTFIGHAVMIGSSGPEENRGEGNMQVSLANYLIALNEERKLSEVDELSPIVGVFKLEKTPEGFLPLEVRERIGHMNFPLRQAYAQYGAVRITSFDFHNVLRVYEDFEAMRYVLEHEDEILNQTDGKQWVVCYDFQTHEGSVEMFPDPVSTINLMYRYFREINPRKNGDGYHGSLITCSPCVLMHALKQSVDKGIPMSDILFSRTITVKESLER